MDYSGIEPIAIIGMAGRFPGASDVEQFWHNLRSGIESVARFSEHELREAGVPPEIIRHPGYVPARAVLDDIETFDAAFFGFNPREAEIIDPQHRLFLESAWHALEDAGYDSKEYSGTIGLFAGTDLPGYLINLLGNKEILESQGPYQVVLGNDKDFLTSRTAFKLDLKGPVVSVQTGCSTSLVAIHLACQSLLDYQCDIALAGGVSLAVPNKRGYIYQEGGIQSPDGHCRTFDELARGAVGGDGLGIVVLKRLKEALDSGDRIIALVRGTAINNDGASKMGYTTPSVDGQARVIAEALTASGISPQTIEYVEAHGTATALGDVIEVAALKEVFDRGEQIRDKPWCGIGSVKSNIGHLGAAAGVAGFIKATLALVHREIPPSLHFHNANEKLELDDSPFFVNSSLRPWAQTGSPRRAGVSSFGIGGTNAHVILEESPQSVKESDNDSEELLVFSAKSHQALQVVCQNLAKRLDSLDKIDRLADVAYTLQIGRQAMERRLAIPCRNKSHAIDRLKGLLDHHGELGSMALNRRSVAFLFPGHGSQKSGMAATLYKRFSVFTETLDDFDSQLKQMLDIDVKDLLCSRSEQSDARMRHTQYAQPALFIFEYALARQWMRWGIQPAAMLGHSVGEYVAACIAGVLSPEEGLEVIIERGRLVEQTSGGSMLAIWEDEKTTKNRLREGVWLAASNAPELTVVTGKPEAIEALRTELEKGDVGYRVLDMNYAFHSGLLDGVLGPFEKIMSRVQLRSPSIPYVSNVTGNWMEDADAQSPHYWSNHLREPVRFSEGLSCLWRRDHPIFLEVGPGQSLSRLATLHKNSAGQPSSVSLPSVQENFGLLETLGKLWENGVQVDWKAVQEGGRRHRVALPGYPFERKRYWINAQSGQHNLPVTDQVPVGTADWFYLPNWKRVNPRSESVDLSSTKVPAVIVFVDDQGLSLKVSDRLKTSGIHPVLVRIGQGFLQNGDQTEFEINPFELGDYTSLFEAIEANGIEITRVAWFWGISDQLQSAANERRKYERKLPEFSALLLLSRALARHKTIRAVRLLLISDGLHAITGLESIEPRKSTILSPGRVLPQEHGHIECRCIDVQISLNNRDTLVLVDNIAEEIVAADGPATTGLRGSTRWVPFYEKVDSSSLIRKSLIRESGVYFITGGLGRIGSLLACWLAERFRARLVLVGRARLPERSEWASWIEKYGEQDQVSRKIQTLRSVEQAGSIVLLGVADVADSAQLSAVWDEALKRFGGIDGIIHAAGVTGEDSVREMSALDDDEIAMQFSAKVCGTQEILRISRNCDLDFCYLFSSIATALGGLGFCAYAAANLYLDGIAELEVRSRGRKVRSVGWDGWQFDGPGRLSSITPTEAPSLFEDLFSIDYGPRIVISPKSVDERVAKWVQRENRGQDDLGGLHLALHPRPQLETEYCAPRTETESGILGLWTQVLGIEKIGIKDSFFELGGHSLLLTQLALRIRQRFSVEITLRSLFESPTIAEMAERVDQALLDQFPDEVDRLIDEIKQLSSQEVTSLLDVNGRS